MSFSLLFSDFNLWTETLRLWASSFTHFIHDMASRMKRLFHRKRDDDASSTDQRDAYPSGSDPALRTSLYDTTLAGGQPQTGDYPLRGNEDSVVLTHQGRKSSIRSRRSSSSQNHLPRRSVTPDLHAAQRNLGASPPPPRDLINPEFSRSPPAGRTPDSNQKRWSHTHLPQDFSNMTIGRESK